MTVGAYVDPLVALVEDGEASVDPLVAPVEDCQACIDPRLALVDEREDTVAYCLVVADTHKMAYTTISMPLTLLALDPQTQRIGLITEIHGSLTPEASVESALSRLKRRMYDSNVSAGLLFTPEKTYVLRDMVTAMEFEVNEVDVWGVETRHLFEHAKIGAPKQDLKKLCDQARRWLQAVGSSWSSFVPDDAVPYMIPEVVGRLAQAEITLLDEAEGVDRAYA